MWMTNTQVPCHDMVIWALHLVRQQQIFKLDSACCVTKYFFACQEIGCSSQIRHSLPPSVTTFEFPFSLRTRMPSAVGSDSRFRVTCWTFSTTWEPSHRHAVVTHKILQGRGKHNGKACAEQSKLFPWGWRRNLLFCGWSVQPQNKDAESLLWFTTRCQFASWLLGTLRSGHLRLLSNGAGNSHLLCPFAAISPVCRQFG